jgi:selenocysteine lyase/cysteine desulfurase
VAALSARSDFEILASHRFLNTAFCGPIPKVVEVAMSERMRARATAPTDVLQAMEQVDVVRGQVASLLNAQRSEIAFLHSTSDGENIVARSLALGPGDNVVTDDLSYHTTHVLGEALARSRGVEFRVVPSRNGAVSAEDYSHFVDGRTKLLIVSAVAHVNGFAHNLPHLAALAHEYGAYLYVDAIQAVGTREIDVRREDVDFLCFGTYKWVMSGFGVAPFYIRRELLDLIAPDRVGWHTAHHLRGDAPYQSAKKFEHASPSFDCYYPLGAALHYLESLGLENIEAHSTRLVSLLREELTRRAIRCFTPAENRAPTISFWVGGPPELTIQALRSRSIEATVSSEEPRFSPQPTAPVTRIRVSCAHFNDENDLQSLIDALADLSPC